MKEVPKRFDVRAVYEKLRAGRTTRRALAEAARNGVCGDEARFEFRQISELDAGELLGDQGGLRAFERKGGEFGGTVAEGDVVHDDVFVESGDEAFADTGVGVGEELVGQGVG